MTLMLLWEEYVADHAGQTAPSATRQFCENYRRFAKRLKRSMRQIHRAGEKLFIDYAGPTVGLTDGSAGPDLRGGPGRLQLHLRLRHAAQTHGRLARIDCAGAALLSAACRS